MTASCHLIRLSVFPVRIGKLLFAQPGEAPSLGEKKNRACVIFILFRLDASKGWRAHSVAVEGDPGRSTEAVDQQREVSLLVGVFHPGQGPIQRLAQVESARPVQPLLHNTVSHSTQFQRFGQRRYKWWSRRKI